MMMSYDSIVRYRMNRRLAEYEQRRKELLAGIVFQLFKHVTCRHVEERNNRLFLRVRGAALEHRAVVMFREYEEKAHQHRRDSYSDGQQLKRELEILDAQAAEAREWLGVIDLEVI